jgi:flagellar biosynthesis/type III secretory pathway protein FliH
MHPFTVKLVDASDCDQPESDVGFKDCPASSEGDRQVEERAEIAERQRLREEARREGFQAGHREGVNQALREVASALADSITESRKAIESLYADRDAAIKCLAEGATRLGLEVAEKVIGVPSLFDRAALVQQIIDEALDAARPGEAISVELAPQTLRDSGKSLPKAVLISENSSLKPGGFIVKIDAPDGRHALSLWDATIERAFEVVRGFRLDG